MPVLKNPKHEAYAQAVARGINKTKAYTDAGYKYSEQSASRLSRNVQVKARIAELSVKVVQAIGQKFDATVDRIAHELCSIAFADPAELFDGDGRLKRVSDLPPHVRAAVASVETVRGGGIKVKLWNKNSALADLGRWRRMFVELQGADDFSSPCARQDRKFECARSVAHFLAQLLQEYRHIVVGQCRV